MSIEKALSTYRKHVSRMKPGDIIAFSGRDLGARIIKQFTNSPYSHVAIVLDVNGKDRIGKTVIAESTTFTHLRNYRNEPCIKGVQIHWLSNWLIAYGEEGQAWWIPLNKQLPHQNIAKMQTWLWQIHNQKVSFSYHKAMKAWLGRRMNILNRKDTSTLFCSELVTKALQIAGVVDPKIDSTTKTPKDVIDFPCFQDQYQILPK